MDHCFLIVTQSDQAPGVCWFGQLHYKPCVLAGLDELPDNQRAGAEEPAGHVAAASFGFVGYLAAFGLVK